MPIQLFLASQSPRRRQLLDQLGFVFEVVPVDIEERRVAGESPTDYVSRVALEKARAGCLAVPATAVVIGADTEVVLGDEVFGKPVDAAAAAEMLHRLSGRSHQVLSTVWCVGAGREICATCVSTVEFAHLSTADITAYVDTGEPFGKAGAYAIQGRAAAFIRRLDGSYSGVMGLPLHETAQILRRFVVE